ncbi:MAG TPA: hypothetical protein VMN36_13390 [Verrucomicrobiales bacterium]|nr:hypothetical protein [Verrucomicrobiales bacterium]
MNGADAVGLIRFKFHRNCSAENQRILQEIGNTMETALEQAVEVFEDPEHPELDDIMLRWYVDRVDQAVYPYAITAVLNAVSRMKKAATESEIEVVCDGKECKRKDSDDSVTAGYTLKRRLTRNYYGAIYICCKNLDMEDRRNLTRAFIHEFAHRFAGVEDYGYWHEPRGRIPGWYVDAQTMFPMQYWHPDTGALMTTLPSVHRLSNTYTYMLLTEFIDE